jgi:hypothetical protein
MLLHLPFQNDFEADGFLVVNHFEADGFFLRRLTAEVGLSSDDVSRFFTGSPTNKAVWLLVGGVAAAIVGLFNMLRMPREN